MEEGDPYLDFLLSVCLFLRSSATRHGCMKLYTLHHRYMRDFSTFFHPHRILLSNDLY